MLVEVEYISAGCNCIYNCLELAPDFLLFGANNALAVYDLQEERVIHTLVAHHGKINCVRFVKNTVDNHRWVVTSGSNGAITLWRACGVKGEENLSNFVFETKIYCCISDSSINVCDGIQINESQILVGTVDSVGEVIIYNVNIQEWTMEVFQQIDIKKSVALDFVFHQFDDSAESIVFALGMDTGSVVLYSQTEVPTESDKGNSFSPVCTLNKHEDWVRCITFVALDNGDVLMASGGEDSFIAVWRFTKHRAQDDDEFEFQIYKFREYRIVFDSLIMGHEGWINSLHWNSEGELLSCSSDQSTVIWQNLGDVWQEKSRFGVMGGQLPGGFGAKFLNNLTVSWGFQGAIQIWTKSEDGEWNVQPSITGHFEGVADLDYHPKGHYVITTSDDQTTRIHAPWGPGRWHEIARPQIHGHDLYAVKSLGNLIVSGAEEKILRAFQPTEIFIRNLSVISEISVDFDQFAPSAFLPVLGLSNQSEAVPDSSVLADTSIEVRLDEDFIRSQTLWAEVSKLYGHVYEISCIATSPVDKLIASGSQATKSQFSAIILWCGEKWKNLGEFPFHKLNVTDMEFSPDGKKLLSVSRDRVWAVWTIIRSSVETSPKFSMQLADSGNFHTRALWVGTWSPGGDYFVTGARDKKLAFWKPSKDNCKYEMDIVESFETSVSAISVNPDGIVAIGLESGEIFFYQYNLELLGKDGKLKLLEQLDNSLAHHDVVKRLKFNPAEKYQLASAGADHIVKIYNITPPP